MRAGSFVLAAGLGGLLLPLTAGAAEIDGASLSPLWAVPFAGLLLSIALMPLLAPAFWHHHFGKVAAAWALAFLIPFAAAFGPAVTGAQFVHALVGEYVPFILLLTALFASVGMAGIPGSGMIILPLVLRASGLPMDVILVAYPLLQSVDWIIARIRSGVNVMGDMQVAILLDAGRRPSDLEGAQAVAIDGPMRSAPAGIDE